MSHATCINSDTYLEVVAKENVEPDTMTLELRAQPRELWPIMPYMVHESTWMHTMPGCRSHGMSPYDLR